MDIHRTPIVPAGEEARGEVSKPFWVAKPVLGEAISTGLAVGSHCTLTFRRVRVHESGHVAHIDPTIPAGWQHLARR